MTNRLGGSGFVTAAVSVILLLGASCAAPGPTPSAPTVSPTPGSQGPATAAPSSPQPSGAGAQTAKPADPTAPATYRPAERNGKKPEPTIKGGNGSFSKARGVTYPDGVSLRVDAIRQGTEKGQVGPGAFPGRAYTAFSLSLHNRSPRALDLTKVVVTAMYGSPARLAPPVYGAARARDFDTKVRAGATATATYLFAIPSQQRGKVTIIVDFDESHVAARFSGAAR